MKILRISMIFFVLNIISSCANNNSLSNANSITHSCKDYKVPSTDGIYLYLSEKYSPDKKIIQILTSNITYSLLRREADVNVIKKQNDFKPDGLLLNIYVINNQRSTFARRIDIKYELIDPFSNKKILKGKDGVKSRFGYNNVAKALGEKIARKIEPIISCFNNRRVKTKNNHNNKIKLVR